MAHVARAILMNRRDREMSLPAEIFADYAWDALLQLFVADVRGHGIALERLADMVRCSPATMRRWVAYLGSEGLAAIDADDCVRILAPARAALADYLTRSAMMAVGLVERGRNAGLRSV